MRRCLRHRFCRYRLPTRCAKDWDSSQASDKKFNEAPFFYWLYTLLIVAGGALVLVIPAQRLIEIVLWSQVLNGILLPFVLDLHADSD